MPVAADRGGDHRRRRARRGVRASAGGLALVAAAYLALQALYSGPLKHIVIIDVLTIAHRLRAARRRPARWRSTCVISHWLFVCTILLALFIALAKRRHELVLLADGATSHRPILGEYSPYLLDQMIAVVTASTLIAYIFYTISPETAAEVRHRPGSGLTIPFPLYGIFRYLYLVHRREGGGSPADLLLNDRPLLACVMLWVVAVVLIIYHPCADMPDFNVRSDSVNVEQIMEQIRARIREKRGVDYTEQQIRELAAVKLEKFLDPRGVRSDLLEQFRQAASRRTPRRRCRTTRSKIRRSSRRIAAPLRWIRQLLQPILKLFFNPNPLIQALHIQSQLNTMTVEREAARRGLDQLHYEVLHNLVIETTRMGIEVKNLKMRVESLTSRLEFNERRARALESVVVYKPPDERERGDGARQSSARGAGDAAIGTARRRDRRRRRSPLLRQPRRAKDPVSAAAGGGAGADGGAAGWQRQSWADRQAPATSAPEADAVREAVGGQRHRRREPSSRRDRPPTRCPDRNTDDPGPGEAVKLAVVVQRYGPAINGGAELHARYIAEHLARHAEVEVLTTCATDYVTWRNELPAGVERVNGVSGPPLPCQARARPADVRPAVRPRVRPAALARRRARLARRRRAGQPGAGRSHRATHARYSTTASSSAIATTTRITARARRRRARSSCRPPNATRRSACRSSSRFSAASAPSCTTRRKSAR